MKKPFLCFLILVAFLCGCSDDSGMADSIVVPDVSAIDYAIDIPGFVKVYSNGAFVDVGSNDVAYKANERPQMRVKFAYDFSIGEHEVTCDEYNDVAKRSELPLWAECDGDIPVTNVSYYDAILFANAKSKLAKKDTAYTYSKVAYDDVGHSVSVEGFSFDPKSNGFRLPTEAEWILVANQGWQTQFTWNASNSNYEPHEVCSVPANAIGVCDMAGNVMEWVNDWMGKFRDTVITNYVGAPDGGSVGERVVKGGSFRNESSATNWVSRGDVYTVTTTTRANYVGFRLAYGSIPDAVWMKSSGEASESLLHLLSGSEKLRSLTGSYKSKLVFRNDLTGNLVLVDYSSGMLAYDEIADTLDAYHPDISPDGKLVAFCTGLEGVDGKSSVYVRELNSAGTNLVRLKADAAAIPRWRVLENGDTVIVYVSSAANNSDKANFKKKSTWQVTFMGGKFGTPKKLFDGNFHGGISADNRLAVTGARLLRARIADSAETLMTSAKDSVWYGGEQACNASLANDGSKRTLFLDFGGKTGRNFVGKSYDTHERLLIADSTGTLVQSVAAPSGYTFDHSEWALNVRDSVGGLAVATLANVNGAHTKIVAVNLQDSSIVELVEGDEVWHPCLWRKQNASKSGESLVDLDSAGVYFNETGGEGAVFLRYKLELLWNYYDEVNVVALGSSRMLGGFNPTLLSPEFFAINMSNVPNTMYVSEYLYKNYVSHQVKHLKYLLVSLDIDLWYKADDSEADNFFYSEYLNYPGFVYDENHDFWKDGVPQGMDDAVVDAPGNIDYKRWLTSQRGFYADEGFGWGSADLVNNDSTWLDYKNVEFEKAFEHLENILKLAKEQKVVVVGVVFPQSPAYRNTGSFGRYGIRRSEAGAIIERIEKLGDKYDNFVLMDENKMGDHDYTDEMAQNQDHLSVKGGAEFTARMDSLLKKLELGR